MSSKTLDIQNLTQGGETSKVMWAPMGKLVPQLLEVVMFTYDIYFRQMIACWKGISEKYTFHHQIMTPSIFWLWWYNKTTFRAPKWHWKYNKMYSHENIQNKLVGFSGMPPISTWKMCSALDDFRSVETTITKKYKRMCCTKIWQEEPVGTGGWPPISTWNNSCIKILWNYNFIGILTIS